MNGEGAGRLSQPNAHRSTHSRQWAAATEHAFASITDRPDVYQLTIRIVGALAEKLRVRCRDLAQLDEAWAHRHELLDETLNSDAQLTINGLEPETVLGAAFGLHERTAAETTAADKRAELISQSRPGDTWITLEESGFSAGDPFVPYRRLEANANTGDAILVTTQPDETMSACIHLVQDLTIDLSTGHLGTPHSGALEPRTFHTEHEREADVRKRAER